MKTASCLFNRIWPRENLLEALRRALRGKREKVDAQRFIECLDENLNDLSVDIRRGDLRCGVSQQFFIYDPKERLITAPCFRERILHHAMMNVCEPEFEKRLIHHTYACRQGKGQFAAIRVAQQQAHQAEYFLKMDVRKYFDSIDKVKLLKRLSRVFREEPLLEMFAQIILAHRPELKSGLPIGSLISQHCANLYLDAVDRHVTRQLGCGAYVRYMDDMVVWHSEKSRLKEVMARVNDVLMELGLSFKEIPYLNRTRHGMDFLGHRIFPDRVILNRRSRVRFEQKLVAIHASVAAGELTEDEEQQRVTALTSYVRHFSDAEWRNAVIARVGERP
jgi:RNA-directed DNA polymerase